MLVVLAVALAVGGFLLWRAVHEDTTVEAATPFDSGELGSGAVGCTQLCVKQNACGVVRDPDCDHGCQTILELEVVTPTCKAAVAALLQCWWRATQRCGPEDACATEVTRAMDCVCRLPNAPRLCKQPPRLAPMPVR